MRPAVRLVRHSMSSTILNTIKNSITSNGDPFEQFNGVGFEQSSLAELSPLGMSSVIRIAHTRIRGLCGIVVNFFRFCALAHFVWHLTDST
jgi:hypothetical protein